MIGRHYSLDFVSWKVRNFVPNLPGRFPAPLHIDNLIDVDVGFRRLALEAGFNLVIHIQTVSLSHSLWRHACRIANFRIVKLREVLNGLDFVES